MPLTRVAARPVLKMLSSNLSPCGVGADFCSLAATFNRGPDFRLDEIATPNEHTAMTVATTLITKEPDATA
jgi:hypothetical protein